MITLNAAPIYIPRDHYWHVGGDASRAWSSDRAAYVPADDAVFAAWRAQPGRYPTPIASEDELRGVLVAAGLADRAPPMQSSEPAT